MTRAEQVEVRRNGKRETSRFSVLQLRDSGTRVGMTS